MSRPQGTRAGGGVFINITVTGMDQIDRSLEKMGRETPSINRKILTAASGFFLGDALANVHVISGRTKSSTHISLITDIEAKIESGYGAPFEENRDGTKNGTPHKFMTGAQTRTLEQLPTIIKTIMDQFFAENKTP